jgi:hypothetical protein
MGIRDVGQSSLLWDGALKIVSGYVLSQQNSSADGFTPSAEPVIFWLFFVARSEAFDEVQITITQARNGQGS